MAKAKGEGEGRKIIKKRSLGERQRERRNGKDWVIARERLVKPISVHELNEKSSFNFISSPPAGECRSKNFKFLCIILVHFH